MAIPPRIDLYKYRSLQGEGMQYALDMLVNNRIYMGTCDQMNDPAEGRFLKGFGFPRAGSYEEIVDNMTVNPVYETVRKIRFCSMCKEPNEVLLWAHYAAGFSGVCFQYYFNTPNDEFQIEKIKYDKIQTLSAMDCASINSDCDPLDYGLLKSKDPVWEYEKEYRIFHKHDRSIKYINVAPSAILFGYKRGNDDCAHPLEVVADKMGVNKWYLKQIDGKKLKFWDTKRQAIVHFNEY